jgi:hypothetical protein
MLSAQERLFTPYIETMPFALGGVSDLLHMVTMTFGPFSFFLFKMEFNMEWSKNGGRLTLQITI